MKKSRIIVLCNIEFWLSETWVFKQQATDLLKELDCSYTFVVSFAGNIFVKNHMNISAGLLSKIMKCISVIFIGS